MATPEQNKTLVLEAFDALFNRRDYATAEDFWSERYIQHSAHIAPGREGLFNLVRSLPHTLRYEHQLVLAEGDYVMLYGRFTGTWQPRCLGRGRRGAHRERQTRRALGRPAGRGDPGRVRERPADVRRPVPARPLTGPSHGHGRDGRHFGHFPGHLCRRRPSAGWGSRVPRLGRRTGWRFNSPPGHGRIGSTCIFRMDTSTASGVDPSRPGNRILQYREQ